MFGEKKAEYSAKQGKEIPVWQSDKYLEGRDKAIEIIKSGVYGLTEADFWINMNETKSGKMAYTGLIISHNGCLKINSKLPKEQKFRPECVREDKEGYNGSLVYTYCCPDQGIYEVGEVNAKNCKIDYPYAMAFKRMMDRVVLKASTLAYAGIYSEVEADEFQQKDIPAKEEKKSDQKEGEDKPEPKEEKQQELVCADCGKPIYTIIDKDGKVKLTAEEIAQRSLEAYGRPLCMKCARKAALDAAQAVVDRAPDPA